MSRSRRDTPVDREERAVKTWAYRHGYRGKARYAAAWARRMGWPDKVSATERPRRPPATAAAKARGEAVKWAYRNGYREHPDGAVKWAYENGYCPEADDGSLA